MADYTISLNNKQEVALDRLVDIENRDIMLRPDRIPITKAEMVERLALGPIKDMVRQIKLEATTLVSEVYADADAATQVQVRAILNIT